MPTQADVSWCVYVCVCCRKGLEKEWDLEQVLTKAFLQVDAALASEFQMYGNGTDTKTFQSHTILLKLCQITF